MRHSILLTLWIFIGQFSLFGQTEFKEWVTNSDTVSLKEFVLKSDIHFGKEWTLEKANIEEIDHFNNGYVLRWTRIVNDIKILRTYVFDLNSIFIRSYEQRFYKDTLLSQGSIEFKNREIQYIQQVIIDKKSLKKEKGYWDYEVDGYYYEIYKNGYLSCTYKTIHLNHYYMLFEKRNKNKIELTKGNDCLSIQK